ncbi:MAG TPA: squalene/phytoene synthase family protein [Xanthomonadales bacterium]|nr:squalene/phytoene synthase family protein [Xanthomonadales bacterium]
MRIEAGRAGRVELSETYKFVRGNPGKNWKLAAGLYALSTQGREMGRAARSGYLFLRHIDDAVDGDRPISGDPQSYVLDLRRQVETGDFRKDIRVSALAKRSLEILDRVKKSTDNPRQDFLDGIDGILFDHRRSKIRRSLSEKELEKYYEDAIGPGLNILLVGTESSLRSSDIPEFSTGLARIYSVRDFKDDWERGIINIPREIQEQAGLTPQNKYEDVINNTLVAQWTAASLEQGKQELSRIQQDPRVQSERLTSIILNGFIKSAKKTQINIDTVEPNSNMDSYH